MAAKGEGKKQAEQEVEQTEDQSNDPALSLAAALKRVSIAKGLLTKSINNLRAALDGDPSDRKSQAIVESLMGMVDRRHEEAQNKFEDLEDLLEDDGDLNRTVDDRDAITLRTVEVKSLYTLWMERVPEKLPAAGAAAGAVGGAGSDKGFISSMAGTNFNLGKVMKTRFSGDVRKYSQFRIEWELAENQMSHLNFSDARKLMELKKAVEGEAAEAIIRLPLEDDNYERAKAMLDRAYKRPIRVAEMVVLDLMDTPRMGTDKKSIVSTLHAIEQAQQALEGLRLSKADIGDLIFSVLCEKKLNNATMKDWAKKKESMKNDDLPRGHGASLDDMKEIIHMQIEFADSFESRKSQETSSKKEEKPSGGKQKEHHKGSLQGSFSAQNQKSDREAKCQICDRTGHRATACFKLTKLKTAQDRVKFLEDENISLCRNCLKGPHHSGACRQANGCTKCTGKHHTLLHFERTRALATHFDSRRQPQQEASQHQSFPLRQEPPPRQEPPRLESQRDLGPGGPAVNAASMEPAGLTPILQSCMAWVLGPGENKMMARIFFDSGSELTMIRRDLAQRLGLDGPCFSLNLRGVGGVQLPSTQEKRVKFRLASLSGDYASHPIEGVTRSKLTDRLREVNLDFTKYPHLQGLNLAEELPRGRVDVDILIGIADYNQLVTGPVLAGEPGEPVAMGTRLGFVLSGTA